MSCCPPSIGTSQPAVVWLASTMAASDAGWSRTQASLFAPSEAQRLERMARPARRVQFVAAHVAIRHLVAARLARPASAINIEVQPDGRPTLCGSELSISLSHSADRVAVAAAGTPIGVDIERLHSGRGEDVVESWAAAEARWKTGNTDAPAWVARTDGFVLAVAGCTEPPTVHWLDLRASTGMAASIPLSWQRASGAPQ